MTRAVAASTSAVRGRSLVRSRFWTRIAILALAAGVLAVGVPLFFAGSADRLADGTRIAGIDVGGMSPEGRSGVAGAALGAARRGAGDVRRRRPGVPDHAEVDGRRGRLACGGLGGRPPGWRRRRRAGLPPARAAAVPAERRPAHPFLRRGRRLRARLARARARHPASPGCARAARAAHHDRAGQDRTRSRSACGPRPPRSGARFLLTRARRASCPPRPAAGDGRLVDGEPDARLADHLRPGDRGRRPDAPARPALAAREAARPAVDAIRRPGRGRVLRSARAQGRPPGEGRVLRDRRQQDQRRPGVIRASRSMSHARWRPCSQQPRVRRIALRRSRSRCSSLLVRPQRRVPWGSPARWAPTRRCTGEIRTAFTTCSSLRISSTTSSSPPGQRSRSTARPESALPRRASSRRR